MREHRHHDRKRLFAICCFSICAILLISEAQASSRHAGRHKGPPPQAPVDTTLAPSVASGAPVGTSVIWTATNPDATSFRFSIHGPTHRERIVRDFDTPNTFQWTPIDEGLYRVSVTAREGASGESETASQDFRVTALATGEEAVVAPTGHSLVALYNLPRCRGGSVRVQFRALGSEEWQETPEKPCHGHSVSFLVAGMRAQTTYELRHLREWGRHHADASTILTFETGPIQVPLPERILRIPPGPDGSGSDPLILHAAIFGGPALVSCPFATELDGTVVWYYAPPCSFANAGSLMNSFPPALGGTFLMHMVRAAPGQPIAVRGQILREIDVAGHALRETNVDRINEQLTAMGHEPIYYFHHDTRRLANGHTLVMAGVERVLEDVQGPGLVDVVGDAVIDLDENWQVVWAWNTFDKPELPITRRALRDEQCGVLQAFNVCGPLQKLAGVVAAHDWTHGNTVTYTPADGNFLVSFRHQDWVIKVDYRDGRGSGRVLWRLGNQGDFTIEQAAPIPDPQPWFSGQHQPMIYAQRELTIYDNGNALNEDGSPANSRGQVYLLDEKHQVARLVTNADLGVYASFLGSSQKLSNGNYHFLSGGIQGDEPSPIPGFPSGFSQSTETNAAGDLLFTLEADVVTYRSFRMKSLYQPAGIPGDVNGDLDVDILDVVKINQGRSEEPSGAYDPRDVNGDGDISSEDVMAAIAQCTLAHCRPIHQVPRLLGY